MLSAMKNLVGEDQRKLEEADNVAAAVDGDAGVGGEGEYLANRRGMRRRRMRDALIFECL